MIKQLTIQNYALIDHLEMHPHEGLNIITGETGAGKSIMLGAVGLLLGQRSDSKALLNTDEKCIIEGLFDISSYKLKSFFEENELDFDSECIIRREIVPSGKSRAFVNDTPVGLQVLKDLGEKLLDVHSQHETLQLKEKKYQLQVLDAFAVHPHLINTYEGSYTAYREAKKLLEELESLQAKGNQDADYKSFLLQELEEAQLDGLIQDELEQELKVLENTEEIKSKLFQASQLIEGDEVGLMQLMAEIKSTLSSISGYSKELDQLSERLESQWLEWQDLSREVAHQSEKTELDPERTQALKDQLDLLYRLQRKHQKNTVEELIILRDGLEKELSRTRNLEKEITTAQKSLKEKEAAMNDAGLQLRESRQLTSQDLAAEIEKIIRKIGIENGRVEIGVIPFTPTADGMDLIEIKFSANKGVAPQEIAQVASGGEFSRLIFAIKYLIASKTALPTVIFDEIDTGVSGEVAMQMIAMMRQMAENHQVIAISHLPQFAAGGQSHYFVYKDNSQDRSVSRIRKLEGEDRIAEIAKMIGGKEPSSSAVESAKELLGFS